MHGQSSSGFQDLRHCAKSRFDPGKAKWMLLQQPQPVGLVES
jgi:hypothetical protein